MKTAVIAIGVSKTGGLQPLSGAISGAEDFAKWGASQGHNVTLIVDKHGKKVYADDVFNAISSVINDSIYEKLIVFFSGHGFLNSPSVELWLLSQSPNYPSEAINLRLSSEFARYCGIPHVIFVSDACRSGGMTHQHRSVVGSSMFPNTPIDTNASEIDVFYATRPGDVALEVSDQNKAIGGYKGIFTECLLSALNGNVPQVVAKSTKNTIKWVIPSYSLKTYLSEEVPKMAQDVSIQLNQLPEIRVESHLPQYFGFLDDSLTVSTSLLNEVNLIGNTDDNDPDTLGFVEKIKNNIVSYNDTEFIDNLDQNFSQEERVFNENMNMIYSSSGRDHFESKTGFTVFGSVKSAFVGGNLKCDLIKDNARTHIRVHNGFNDSSVSILIELESGFGTVLAVIPGFIGTVMIDDAQVVNVNYTPSINTPFYYDYDRFSIEIEQRRAFAATATRHGVFKLNTTDAEEAGNFLRKMKRLDPTFGIYAAYAYSQAGNLKQIRSVLNYMSHFNPIPFDVFLLSRQYDKYDLNKSNLSPFCPMLNQGWALLDLHAEASQKLHRFKKYLLPSLWTLFSQDGVMELHNSLKNGELT